MTWIYSLTISHQSFHPTLPPRLLWTVYYHPCIAFRPHAKSLELPHLLPKSFCFARLRKTRTHGTHSTHGTRCSTARWLPTAGVVPWHFTWRGLWCSCRSCIHLRQGWTICSHCIDLEFLHLPLSALAGRKRRPLERKKASQQTHNRTWLSQTDSNASRTWHPVKTLQLSLAFYIFLPCIPMPSINTKTYYLDTGHFLDTGRLVIVSWVMIADVIMTHAKVGLVSPSQVLGIGRSQLGVLDSKPVELPSQPPACSARSLPQWMADWW